MAPILESVYNNSGNSVHLTIGYKSFDIQDGASQQINMHLTTEEYAKIFNIEHEDQEYLLKYNIPNININDALGKNNGIEDSSIQLDSNKTFCLSMLKDEMHIICDGKFLGIYQTDGTIVYYTSVAVFHKIEGGVIVQGDNTVEEESTGGPNA
ncbi:unnamed protein product [Thlaspi arvense]|uniref:Uncharacterized protein n=1 Tax=Thlaspi arvense TaxID=13288 RepID=A0AAU9RRB1_THLAR|nr:unnamed protein product [Thlaspi arvense]